MFLCSYCSLFNNLMFKVDIFLIFRSEGVTKAKNRSSSVHVKQTLQAKMIALICSSQQFLPFWDGQKASLAICNKGTDWADHGKTVLLVQRPQLRGTEAEQIKVVNIHRRLLQAGHDASSTLQQGQSLEMGRLLIVPLILIVIMAIFQQRAVKGS